MPELLMTIFETLNQAQIQYCLLRDADRLSHTGKKQELDLLVRQDQLLQLQGLLQELGFIQLPDWGYAPHHFFLAYHSDADSWLKLDVVTEIAYGHPIQTLRTGIAAGCLADRQRLDQFYVPSHEYELVTLLLHCLLDKGASAPGDLAPSRLERLAWLGRQIGDESRISSIFASLGLPDWLSARMLPMVKSGDWEGLLAERENVSRYLARSNWFGTLGRSFLYPVLRKLNHWINARRPFSIAVALIAPDGAGKSTLAKGLKDSFYFPTRLVYMGIYQKESSRASATQLPGISFIRRLFRQWSRYRTARLYRARRQLVIFDRHPYDEMLAPASHQTPLKRWRRWLLMLGSPKPDLVIFLDAPGETLFARKGEHTPASLEQKRQAYLHLLSSLPHLAIVDASQDADRVRSQALALIWKAYLDRQIGRAPTPAMQASAGERKSLLV